MSIVSIYAGAEQADIAMLTSSSGVSYWCVVWLAAGGQRVEAKVIAEGEDGQKVVVDASIVATVGGTFVDCPRVLAVEGDNESLFVIHWIDESTATTQYRLHRSIFDVDAIASGWSAQGAVSLHSSLLYDAAPVKGATDGGFVVARRTAADTITVERFLSPWSWVDTDWSEAPTGLTIANNVLACYAYEGESVIVCYQSGDDLDVFRLDASGGGNYTTNVLFIDVLDGATNFTAALIDRVSSTEYVVAVECLPVANTAAGDHRVYSRAVAWTRVASDDVNQLGDSQWCWNLHLLSLWSWAAGTTGQTEIYAAVAYKSIADGQEFDQQYAYVVRLDEAATSTASGPGVIKPVPCAAIMGGTIDARPHGSSPSSSVTDLSIGSRLNHCSRAAGPPQYTLGRHVAAKSFAAIRWGRLVQAQNADVDRELQPAEAGVALVTFEHEPPWTVRRSDDQPTQPVTPAWRGLSRALCLPVDTPAGLLLTGGVASGYDGECAFEAGFLWAPEIVAITDTDLGGSMDDAGTYYWFVNYIWPDNRGGFVRGPPSRPVSVEVGANGFATLTVRCLNLSMAADRTRYPLNARVSIEVWRNYVVGGVLVTEGSETQGTAVYLFRSEFGGDAAGWQLQDLPSNDPDEYTVEIVVGRPNATVRYNELAPYQLNLSTLQWTPPPPIPHQPLGPSCTWQNRVFTINPESRVIAWSEEITQLGSRWQWPYFLDTNVFPLHGLGEISAIAPIENDLAVMTRDGIFALAGDPGAGGSGNTFQLRVVARGIGCIEPRSVCTFTDGITFQSAKGRIHVFTRGSGIEDIGAPIEDLLRDAGNVRSAVYLEDRDEIRFTFQEEPGTGPLLVRPRIAIFNLRTKIWVIRNLPMAAQSITASRLNEMMHACAWRGRQGETIHVVLAQGGLFFERSSTSTDYSDDSASGSVTVRLDCTTEWIHLGLDSTKRFHEIGIQTERVNDGALTVEAWYDQDGSWDSDDGAAQQTLEVASPAPAFIRFRPDQGKCRGIKLRIYEPDGVPATENVRLVALVLHYSAKKQRQGSRNNAA